MLFKKEINMVEKFNEENNNTVEIIIDPFEEDFWFIDKNTGKRLSAVEEKKIWEYYGE